MGLMPDPWRKSYLYRCFDAGDVLLYVGVTFNVSARKSQHRKRAAWFSNVKRVSIETFDSRHEAELAEYRVIQTERPKINRVGADMPHLLDRNRISVEAWYELHTRRASMPEGFFTPIDDAMRHGRLQ